MAINHAGATIKLVHVHSTLVLINSHSRVCLLAFELFFFQIDAKGKLLIGLLSVCGCAVRERRKFCLVQVVWQHRSNSISVLVHPASAIMACTDEDKPCTCDEVLGGFSRFNDFLLSPKDGTYTFAWAVFFTIARVYIQAYFDKVWGSGDGCHLVHPVGCSTKQDQRRPKIFRVLLESNLLCYFMDL
jgi:hypothetical protein